MDGIINWSIVGAWQNWLLVAFSALLVILVLHLFMRDNDNFNPAVA